jgi:hypothetical protein
MTLTELASTEPPKAREIRNKKPSILSLLIVDYR